MRKCRLVDNAPGHSTSGPSVTKCQPLQHLDLAPTQRRILSDGRVSPGRATLDWTCLPRFVITHQVASRLPLVPPLPPHFHIHRGLSHLLHLVISPAIRHKKAKTQTSLGGGSMRQSCILARFCLWGKPGTSGPSPLQPVSAGRAAPEEALHWQGRGGSLGGRR